MAKANQTSQGQPAPAPALKRLDKLVGTWNMKGHLVGSKEENITGQATFQWLESGLFMQQDVEINFAGMLHIISREIIGYDPETDTFPSHVYANMSPTPLPYRWDIKGNSLTITVSYGSLNSTFKGTISKDGNSYSGGWRPNPGADETVNVGYDISGTRIK